MLYLAYVDREGACPYKVPTQGEGEWQRSGSFILPRPVVIPVFRGEEGVGIEGCAMPRKDRNPSSEAVSRNNRILLVPSFFLVPKFQLGNVFAREVLLRKPGILPLPHGSKP